MSKTIMIVDDSEVFRKIVRVCLKNSGYELIECSDGVDALNQLTGQKISLIISDVNMPNMDGLTLAKQVKEKEEYKFTPIIMLTTEHQEDKKQQGKDIGVRAWLVKPFSPEELLDSINKILV